MSLMKLIRIVHIIFLRGLVTHGQLVFVKQGVQPPGITAGLAVTFLVSPFSFSVK